MSADSRLVLIPSDDIAGEPVIGRGRVPGEIATAVALLYAPEPLILRYNDLEPILPIGATAMWLAIKTGAFPSPVRLTERAIGFWNHEIREWLKGRPRWSPTPPTGRRRGRPRKISSVSA